MIAVRDSLISERGWARPGTSTRFLALTILLPLLYSYFVLVRVISTPVYFHCHAD